ncbi:MAG: glycosyltransferase family 2 protein [Draconibacterium sp.]
MTTFKQNKNIAVVIPCYKVKQHILEVIGGLNPFIDIIVVVDDKCPENSGNFVEKNCNDPRVTVVYNQINKGVGGATIQGFKKALELGSDVIIKVDGDGQMNPEYIPQLISPILNFEADYTKGNRFYFLNELRAMPNIRLFGNSVLSMINKIVTGYWGIADPTNGYTAISKEMLKLLPLEKIDNRYFFESDMLFRLSTSRAVVLDIPMHAKYGDEISNLNIWKTAFFFPFKYLIRFIKRIFYLYFLRDFNIGTIHLAFGLILFIFGVVFGATIWARSILYENFASTGTVMLSVLPIILGFQLLLSFISYDIQNQPKVSIGKLTEKEHIIDPDKNPNTIKEK